MTTSSPLCRLPCVPARNNNDLVERRKCSALAHIIPDEYQMFSFVPPPFMTLNYPGSLVLIPFFVIQHYTNCLPSTLNITCWDSIPVKSCSMLFTSSLSDPGRSHYHKWFRTAHCSRGCINDEHTVWRVRILDNRIVVYSYPLAASPFRDSVLLHRK